MWSVGMKSKLLSFLVVFCLTFALSTPVETAQAGYRVTISWKITIKITITGTYRSSSSMPSEYRLTPQDVKAVRGIDGSSVDISWSPPLNGAPSKGYEVELALKSRRLTPDTSGSWSLLKHKVAPDVNTLQVNDLEPSRIYEVMVRSIDGYGEHSGEPTSFCSPSFSTSDLVCIFNITASKGTYIAVPESKFDPSSTFWDLPDKGPKTGSINVSWSPAQNARSYVVQWDGLQSPRDFGEKAVPSSQNSTLITGLPGNHQYNIRVLALGLDGLYSESFTTRAYASPSSSTGPILSGGKGEANVATGPFGGGPWVTKEYIRISITPQANSSGQSDMLKTEAFLTRFRKNGETLWKNADVVLNELPRLYYGTPVGFYPNNKDIRQYFLPDLVSDFEFQVAEVSASPSGGRVVGDWSISEWFGPNRTALNRSELDKRTPLGDSTRAADAQCYSISTSPERLECLRKVDAFMTKGTSALERFEADSAYRESIERRRLLAQAAAELKVKQEAEAKAAAELKAKQEAEAKAAAELKAKQEAEAKAAAELKAKQEAEAKAAAELKAKQEAEAKAAAELKAKQEAEAKAARELRVKQEAEAKAAAELKAKQEAEAKAAADKAAGEKIIADAKAEAARILAAAKAAAVTKKTTITCVKGKLVKKVTAVKPKCPSGYRAK
jgi:hypothetical protein